MSTRPFAWSARRELWENRSIVVAPLVAAAVMLSGFLLSLHALPQKMTAALALDPASQGDAVSRPFHFVPIVLMVTMLIVGVVYSLGALYGERRDRSVLFWKSLPVSDLTTVLAKASIPLVVLPVVVFAVVIATQWVMLLLATAVLLATGPSPAILWTQVPWLRMSAELLYGLAAMSVWYAPVHGWLLLVSAWARRTPFLWAVLPPLALCVIERVAFGTTHVVSVLVHRLTGWMGAAFGGHGGAVPQPAPDGIDAAGFLTTPGLWVGLVVAAGLLVGAAWLRRNREPI